MILPPYCISVRQPWAWLIVHGLKDIENRSWPTKFRGPVCIHAAKGMTAMEYLRASVWVYDMVGVEIAQRIPHVELLDRGGIVGTTVITDCVSSSLSPWFMGEYGFVLDRSQSRPVPFIPCRGSLGFFRLPE